MLRVHRMLNTMERSLKSLSELTRTHHRKTASDNGLEQSLTQFRLEATRDAQKLSRMAFLISNVISLAIILITWNAYYSWYTCFPLREDFYDSEVTEQVQKELLGQWVQSQMMTVPFLGVKVGVSDASVFGSLALLIINVWFFLSLRREYFVIKFLLEDTLARHKDRRLKKQIYHGIISYMVFTNISREDEKLGVLNCQGNEKLLTPNIRAPFKVLLFLPTLSIAFIIFSDIFTVLFLKAFYRFPHDPLYEHFGYGDMVKILLMEGFAFLLLVMIVVLCIRMYRYVRATSCILKEYLEHI